MIFSYSLTTTAWTAATIAEIVNCKWIGEGSLYYWVWTFPIATKPTIITFITITITREGHYWRRCLRQCYELHLQRPQINFLCESSAGSVVITASVAEVEGREYVLPLLCPIRSQSTATPAATMNVFMRKEARMRIDEMSAYTVPTDVDVNVGVQWLQHNTHQHHHHHQQQQQQLLQCHFLLVMVMVVLMMMCIRQRCWRWWSLCQCECVINGMHNNNIHNNSNRCGESVWVLECIWMCCWWR